jgi:GntR family transcriptional regulator
MTQAALRTSRRAAAAAAAATPRPRAFRRPVAGPIPLYHQIEQNLRERIASAEFRPDEPLPPEDVLAREYDVSRMTLRRALDALLESRLISKRRGIGTFVSRVQGPRKNVTLVGRLDDAFFHAEQLSYQVLSRQAVRIDAADPVVVDALQVAGVQRTVDRLEVVALTNGQPYAYSEFYFPDVISAQLATEELAGSVPILRVVEARIGERVSWADQTVEPVLPTRKVARWLGIPTRRPILQMRRTYHTADGRAVEAAVVRYHPDRYAYSAQLLARP